VVSTALSPRDHRGADEGLAAGASGPGAVGLSPTRVHRLVTGADLDVLDAALGELRAAGWPAPEDPDTSEDTELDGRDLIADRLTDEVEWLRRCAGWLHHLHVQTYPPVVNLRPASDWPDTAPVVADLPRIQAILERIATDVDELARARRVEELDIAAVRPDRRAEQRRRAAEDDLDFRQFGARTTWRCPRPFSWNVPGMPGRQNDTDAARSTSGPATATTPSAHTDHPTQQNRPSPPRAIVFSKLNDLTVLAVRLLPTPQVRTVVMAICADTQTPLGIISFSPMFSTTLRAVRSSRTPGDHLTPCEVGHRLADRSRMCAMDAHGAATPARVLEP
jgi:hypothetical protein